MRRRFFIMILILALLVGPVHGAEDYIKWVDFNVSYEAMDKALALDIRSQEQDMPVSWIDLLALAACRTGGKVTGKPVEQAYQDLQTGQSPQELLGELFKYYSYYHQAYDAALGGLVGNYAILVEDDRGEKIWKASYGLKAFSPIAAGYGYSHCDDFGVGRSYGFARKHLGNDLMGALGTPIVAVEAGTVEAISMAAGGWESDLWTTGGTITMPTCKRTRPSPRGCRREIWSRLGRSSALWDARGIPHMKTSIT